MPTFFNVWRLTVVHSYSKKMLESGDNQIKKKTWTFDCSKKMLCAIAQSCIAEYVFNTSTRWIRRLSLYGSGV
jgi:hypothetical protein